MRLIALLVLCVWASACSSTAPDFAAAPATSESTSTSTTVLASTSTTALSIPATAPSSESLPSTTAARLVAKQTVELVQEGSGAWAFGGEAQVPEGTLAESDVWIFLLDENGERSGARALVGSAAVDESGVAVFEGVLPAELGGLRDGFVFEPLVAGDYEVVISSYPDVIRQQGNFDLGLTVTEDLEVPAVTDRAPSTTTTGELLASGIGEAAFGDDGGAALAKLTQRFGEPTMDSGWYQGCVDSDPPIRVLWWDFGDDYVGPVLTVELHGTLANESFRGEEEFLAEWVSDQQLANYDYSVNGTQSFNEDVLQTPTGIHPGMSIQGLRKALPDVKFHYSGDDSPPIPNRWIAGEYSGWITSDPTDPNATVGSVSAGKQLFGLPC